MGLAISTKTLALGTVPILIIISWLNPKKILNPLVLILIPLLVSFPWFLSAYNNTGYPFYPIGAGILDSSHHLNFDLWNIPRDYIKLFLFPEDIISPLYVIFLPFLFFVKYKRAFFPLITFYILSFVVWFIIPRTGGGRFILPYLPVWSVFIGLTVFYQKNKLSKLLLTCLIIGSIFINVFYRGAAISRNIPYFLGEQTKTEFLCSRLDFKTSVFVDCDNFFARTIKPTDLVLIKDVHNLYYVNFPFVHETWYKGEKYTHVLTQKPIKNRTPFYKNQTTKIYLYKN